MMWVILKHTTTDAISIQQRRIPLLVTRIHLRTFIQQAAHIRRAPITKRKRDSLLQQSNNYNADVYAASQKAEIEVRGLYLMLCVSTAGDSAAVAEMFLND